MHIYLALPHKQVDLRSSQVGSGASYALEGTEQTPTKRPHPQSPCRSGNPSLAPNDGTTTTTCSHQTKSYSTQPTPPTTQIATPTMCPQSTAHDTDGAGASGHSSYISSSGAPGAHCPSTEKHAKSTVLEGRPPSRRRGLGPAHRAGPSPAWEFASSTARPA